MVGTSIIEVRDRRDLPSMLGLIRVDMDNYIIKDLENDRELIVPTNTVNALLPDMSYDFMNMTIRYSDGRSHVIQMRTQDNFVIVNRSIKLG
jgi:hypothetical protein